MLIQLLFAPINALITVIINLLPTGYALPSWSIEFYNMASTALYFFPAEIFYILMAQIAAYYTAMFIVSTAGWVIRKIPGVE